MNIDLKRIFTTVIRAALYLIIFFYYSISYAQVRNISGVINSVLTGIDSVYSKNNTNPDSLVVKSITGFAVGDTVLVIQSAGARVDRTFTLKGYIADLRNTGRYAIFIIKGINPARKLVVLNTSVLNYTSLVKGEMGQLIKVPTYKRALVTGTLTCDPYNPVTGTGGVLVMMIEQSLKLNANIDVTGKGFPGADPGSDEYGGPCSYLNAAYRDSTFFFTTSADSAARKGYGVFDTTFNARRGRGFATNAGGGGNGLYSGGGGGGHYKNGGVGGDETNLCNPLNAIGGLGGKDMTTFYTGPKIFMGGGGGTGTQKPSQGRLATRGGAGGGIVIIISDTIIGNGNRIMSQGETVTGLSTAGAGGGGAGGAIILHAFRYNTSPTTLTLDVKGGDGGNVNSSVDRCGPGGGGSAGIIWFNGLNPPAGPVSFVTTGGNAGKWGSLNLGAANGGNGFLKNNLNIQIRGFIYNKIPDGETICQDETPAPFNAPPAIGGTGSYVYLWEQSNDNINWAPAAGKNDSIGYVPGVLTNTTHYRRIVDDLIIPRDTSRILTIIVHPRLNNNAISPDTTVCSGLTANSIYGPVAVTGGLGPGSYAYNWEQSANNSTWTNAQGIYTNENYATPVLSDTIYYRRKISSGACRSTSNSVKISVLEPLTGNDISADQIICYKQTFTPLAAGVVSGGEPADRKYLWQQNYSGTWTDTVTTFNFTPLTLVDSVRYRRIVYSGLNNTCANTSNEVTITVLPRITNNLIINSSDSVFCAGLVLDSLRLNGTAPDGGDKPDFTYIWQKRLSSGSVWTNAETSNVLKPFNAGVLYDTTYFRRLIFSGANDVCRDTSSSVLMKVLPELTNNTISDPQTICAHEIPSTLTGSVPAGGNGLTPDYLWQRSATPSLPASWVSATGIINGKDYSPPSLSSTVHYRRIVLSGPAAGTCRDTTTALQIEVQNDITSNSITNPSPVFTCFNTVPDLLTGTTKASGGLAGGDETNYSYTWLESPDGISWDPASQSNNNADYQAEALTAPKYYKRYVISGACRDTSSIVKIDTTHIPVLYALTAQNTPICYFGADPHAQINITIQEGYAPYTVEYSNGQSGTGTTILPARSGNFRPVIINPPNDSLLYNYTVNKITDKNGCEATVVNLNTFNVPVKVYATPSPVVNPKFIEVCDSVITLSPVPSYGTPQWEFISSMSENMFVPDQLNQTNINLKADFRSNMDFSSEAYLVYREYKANCYSSDSVHVIFYKNPQTITNLYRVSLSNEIAIGDTLIVFISDNQDMKADSVTMGKPEWKITDGPAEFTTNQYSRTRITGLDFDTPSTFEYTINNGVCDASRKTVKVIRRDFFVYDGFSPNDDGVNDVLYAKGLYDEEINFRFLIFSGSGSFIRELSRKDVVESDFIRNEVILWDGTTKIGGSTDKIPDGTYYYVLTVSYKGQKFDKKGYFIVKR